MTEWNGGAGPRIVAIGGGTGLSTILRGLKSRIRSLAVIVTVVNDGDGPGMLRQDLGMPPSGDIRHCMEALANAEPVTQQLLAYRFPEGSSNLAGQSSGNLILAALNSTSDSSDQTVARMSEVLAISSRALPVINKNVALETTLENGTRMLGESKISAFRKEQDCHIENVCLSPEHPKALPEAVRAIGKAELTLLGPGSLYASVVPNLLVGSTADAVRASNALKTYICNIMIQDGETEGMIASDHIKALLDHSGLGLVDLCLRSSASVHPGLMERYREGDAAPIVVDRAVIEALGVEAVTRSLASETLNYARHFFARLAEAAVEPYSERADTKIF